MSEGAWIFLSHSHRDFDRVSQLRNGLEDLGHHPLMFFLKCLDDDSEIDDLIRREIQVRSWFIFCDSPHARNSRWVTEERRIIQGLSTHSSATVDLDDPIATQLSSVSRLMRQASVFLSYAQSDEKIARQIEQSLRAEDFGVFSDLQIPPGAEWLPLITSAIDDAVERGAVLVLLSLSSVASQWQRREIELALDRAKPGTYRRNVVPVFLGPPARVLQQAPDDVSDAVGRLRTFDFSAKDFSAIMSEVKSWLRSYEWRE